MIHAGGRCFTRPAALVSHLHYALSLTVPSPLPFPKKSYSTTCLVTDPHSPTSFAATDGRAVKIYDLRSGSPSCSVVAGSSVSCLDYNPNKPSLLLLGTSRGICSFYDIRSPLCPVRSLNGHKFPLTSVKYNRFHDQLCVSGDEGGKVSLWRAGSVSSSPLLEISDAESGGAGEGGLGLSPPGDEADTAAAAPTKPQRTLPDSRVSTAELEGDVAGLCWSACDAWCYLAVGRGGGHAGAC